MGKIIRTYINDNHVVFDILGFKAKFRLDCKDCCEWLKLQNEHSILQKRLSLLEKNNELKDFAFDKLPMLNEIITTEPFRSIVFYNHKLPADYYSYYFSDNFEKQFHKLLNGLNDNDKKYLKTIILRNLFIEFLYKEKFYSSEETEKFNQYQKAILEHCIKHTGYCECNGFKFKNENYEKNVILIGLGLNKVKNIEYFKNKDIIDLGACIGDSSFIFSKYTNKKVWAFEPFTKNYNELIENINLNHLENVIAVNLACGDKEYSLPIYETETGHEATCMDKERIERDDFRNYKIAETVKTVRLDDFVKENNLNVGLIKIDIEGFEMNALKGAIETIKTFKPTLLLSIYHKASDFFEIKPFIENLGLNYHFSYSDDLPGDFNHENVLVCEVKDV